MLICCSQFAEDAIARLETQQRQRQAQLAGEVSVLRISARLCDDTAFVCFVQKQAVAVLVQQLRQVDAENENSNPRTTSPCSDCPVRCVLCFVLFASEHVLCVQFVGSPRFCGRASSARTRRVALRVLLVFCLP